MVSGEEVAQIEHKWKQIENKWKQIEANRQPVPHKFFSYIEEYKVCVRQPGPKRERKKK